MPRSTRHTWKVPTREVFYDLSAADNGGSEGAFGGGLVDTADDDAWITGYVPWDFRELKEMVIVVIPQTTQANAMTFRIQTNYGNAGESAYVHGSTVDTALQSTVENMITEISINGYVNNIKAGDYFGVLLRMQAGQNTNLLVIGVRLRYI